MLKESFRINGNTIIREVAAGRLHHESIREFSFDKELSEQPSDFSHLWWKSYLRGERQAAPAGSRFGIVDLFCATGGLSLGAHEAAISCGLNPKTLFCSDMDLEALKVYKRNLKPIDSFNGNVSSLVDFHVYGREESAELAYPPEIINEQLARHIGKVDLLVAGPPCQGHSTLNNHTRCDDPRNQLYTTAVSVAIALKAKLIVIENVPNVIHDAGSVVKTSKKILEDSGYSVSEGVLSSTDLGGWQTRKRHFMVATKSNHLEIQLAIEAMRKPQMTLREAIGDIENMIPTECVMTSRPVLSSENLTRIDYLFDNDLYDLPNQVRPDCHKDGHSYPSVYGRLSWDKPAPTITTGFMSPGRGRFIHPSMRRCLIPLEAARIQGFPDWYDFVGDTNPSRTNLTKWIGDAVPSYLGYGAVLTALSGY